MKTKNWFNKVGFSTLGLALWCTAASAQGLPVSPLVSVGGGYETAVGRSGHNILLRLEAGIGLGGAPCATTDESGNESPGYLNALCRPRQTQMVIMHVNGALAIDPTQSGLAAINFLDARFTPLSVPPAPQRSAEIEDWMGRYGINRSFHVSAAPTRVMRDPRLRRDLSVRVSIVGIDAELQTFPLQVLGIYASVAADVLGYRYLHQDNFGGGTGGEAHGVSLAEGRVEAGLIFAPSREFVIRLTGGASYEATVDLTTGSSARAIHDVEVFAQLSVALTRLVELYARVGYHGLFHDGFVNNDYLQVTTGATVRFDW